ncbi:hypothetical protein J8F10_09295 [Gemmata sp. G18]|uniref:Uncharacterized protein n=1 Tax=Gemmata palustris TaxID=2822762 RepID=A0ABS5BQ94_9BACT|nr:hypothetical protein [Gemmata palustris]MBP3955475.1 hypothetical protein [Gemmata palustris]
MNDDDICLLCKKHHEPQPTVVLYASPEDSAEQWAKDTALLVRAFADMHRMAFGHVSPEGLVELARGCMENGSTPPYGSLLARCITKLESANLGSPEYDRLRALADANGERLALLAASVHGALTGLGEVGA